MNVSKPKKRHSYKLFRRKSLLVHFKSQNHLKYHLYSSEKKSRLRYFIKNLHQTYRSLCLVAIFIIRLFTLIDKITKEIFLFIEKLIQIIKVIHGWIQMLRAIFSTLHLLTSRIMLLSLSIHRICHLLSVLFQPLSNRTFEKSIRSFSHFLFYYYSSNGACYTLQDRTRHIVEKVRTRWKRKPHGMNDDDDDIYFDAFDEEDHEWFY